MRGGDELGRVGKVVLPVGIHLQNVGVAVLGGVLQACFHRRAFAAVALAEQHANAVCLQILQHGAAVFARAVINNQYI